MVVKERKSKSRRGGKAKKQMKPEVSVAETDTTDAAE
jgi:hypothetical protein